MESKWEQRTTGPKTGGLNRKRMGLRSSHDDTSVSFCLQNLRWQKNMGGGFPDQPFRPQQINGVGKGSHPILKTTYIAAGRWFLQERLKGSPLHHLQDGGGIQLDECDGIRVIPSYPHSDPSSMEGRSKGSPIAS